ncbi:MAG: YlxR family protein [Candidatus Desulfovibrio faecigallinarum]|nr:YlxR family protein [Candidatus Desulfovibrio faecigallinarum]
MTKARQNSADGPVRMCVICRQRFLKTDLLRYTLTPEGCLALDEDKTRPGRGWYVCEQESCKTRLARFRPAKRRAGRKKHERKEN